MKSKLNLRIAVFSLFVYILFFVSCGGGGGAGGASLPDSQYSTHNPGGWGGNGGSGSGGSSSGGTDGVNTIGSTSLPIDHYVYGGATYTSVQLNDLIAVMRDDPNRPTGVFTIQFYVAGEADPRDARITKTDRGIEKFEHQYKANCIVTLSGTDTTYQRTYYADTGINLSDITTNTMAGWSCIQTGTMHNGSIVRNVSGDITLNAVFNAFPANADKNVLYAGVTAGDTATITMENMVGTPLVVSCDSLLSTDPATPAGSSTYTMTVNISGGSTLAFNDGDEALLTIKDTATGLESNVRFTLYNKYKCKVQRPGSTDYIAPGEFNSGETLAFSYVDTALAFYLNGKQVLALKDTASGGHTFRRSDSSTVTFNSDNFSSRDITLQSYVEFEISAKNAADSDWAGTTYTAPNGDSGNLYRLEKNSTITNKLKLTVDSHINVGSPGTTLINWWCTTPGIYNIELTDEVTHESVPGAPDEYIYKIPLTDTITGVVKNVFIQIAQPPGYSYSIKYLKSDGTYAAVAAMQNVPFTPGNQITALSSYTTLGSLDNTLSGVEAASPITGWENLRPAGSMAVQGSWNNNAPNIGTEACEPDLTITLVPKSLYNSDNCRQNENQVQTGDIMLTNGLCITSAYYNVNSTQLSDYKLGTVCKDDGNNKWIMGTYSQVLKWTSLANTDIHGLDVNVTGDDDGSGNILINNNLTINPTALGTDSASMIQSEGYDPTSDDFKAFQYCSTYGNNYSLPPGSAYTSGWYLPSIYQLKIMYVNNILYTTHVYLLSSSQVQVDDPKYWCLNRTTGTIIKADKTNNSAYAMPCHSFSFVQPPSP